jgi:transposase
LAECGERRLARRLSLDEASRRPRHEPATVVSDLDHTSVIEVLDGRDRPTLERYLRASRLAPAGDRRRLDRPLRGLRQAIRTELAWVWIVIDHFHLVRGANAALDSIPRELQRSYGARR